MGAPRYTPRTSPPRSSTSCCKNAFPIETYCGGRASCGRDLIRIHAGAEFVSPRRDVETRRLAALAAEGEPSGPDMRLACQSYVRGDVEIEVIHLRRRE